MEITKLKIMSPHIEMEIPNLKNTKIVNTVLKRGSVTDPKRLFPCYSHFDTAEIPNWGVPVSRKSLRQIGDYRIYARYTQNREGTVKAGVWEPPGFKNQTLNLA
jgi:hypothetical protein